MAYHPVTAPGSGLEMQPAQRDSSYSDTMKEISKARLRRRVLANPELATKLVALEASPVYNSNGRLIQATGESALHATL